MARVEFTKKQRAEIWLRAAGHCEGCSAKLKVGEGDYDHIIPFELSRDTSVTNGQLLCRVCHSAKTHSRDRKDIAKVHRMEAKHKGTWPKSRAPLRSRGFSPTRSALDRPSFNPEIMDGDHE